MPEQAPKGSGGITRSLSRAAVALSAADALERAKRKGTPFTPTPELLAKIETARAAGEVTVEHEGQTIVVLDAEPEAAPTEVQAPASRGGSAVGLSPKQLMEEQANRMAARHYMKTGIPVKIVLAFGERVNPVRRAMKAVKRTETRKGKTVKSDTPLSGRQKVKARKFLRRQAKAAERARPAGQPAPMPIPPHTPGFSGVPVGPGPDPREYRAGGDA